MLERIRKLLDATGRPDLALAILSSLIAYQMVAILKALMTFG